MTEPHSHPLSSAPVMCDVAGLTLAAHEKRRLQHPLTGGVILFARNFSDSAQLCALTAAIRAVRADILLAVDHEGGRVQRFREPPFTALPPMRALGAVWQQDRSRAAAAARAAGLVLAAELRAHGLDLSFAPVLDLDYGVSRAIGNRAFARDPRAVAELAGALGEGMAQAGMACVGKHFPGHGFIEADSHVDLPRDPRDFAAIWAEDVAPYRIWEGEALAGIMPAHVCYPEVDPFPAGFSHFWLQEVLRGQLGFGGAIFSDDLSMEGASVAGDIVARAEAARKAGCDMVLVCNAPDDADQLLARWQPGLDERSAVRLARLRGQPCRFDGPASLLADAAYLQARELILALPATP